MDIRRNRRECVLDRSNGAYHEVECALRKPWQRPKGSILCKVHPAAPQSLMAASCEEGDVVLWPATGAIRVAAMSGLGNNRKGA